MKSKKNSSFIFAALFFFVCVMISIQLMPDDGITGSDSGVSGRESSPARTQAERRSNMGNRTEDLKSTSSRGDWTLGMKSGRDQMRMEIQRDVRMILDGTSILEYLPDYKGLETMVFLEELQNALKADLSSSGDFGKIEKIFNDLEGGGKNLGGIKIPLLRFIPQLKSGAGVSSDVTKKISLYETLNRSDFVMSFSNYLASVGAEKAPGPVDGGVISAIPVADRKSLLWGMARSGDMDAITTAMGVQEEADRGLLLEYTVNELMKSQPGKTISYIDEMEDPVQREFCLTFAVEALRLAGATVEAEEWAKQLQSLSDKN